MTRFRVDPAKVRVAVRAIPFGFAATVELRDGTAAVGRRGKTARAAIFRALHAAKRRGFDGIDLGMQWAYEHPWRSR